MRPLTCNTPKAMVPVLNRPFLEHVIRHLGRHQVKDMVLTLGQSSKSIENYFGDGSRFGVRLGYTIETEPLGTAGAVKNAEEYLDESFLVLNGDIFTGLDLTAMIAFHREKGAKATIAITPVADPTSYGLVFTDDRGRVARFLEKPSRDQATTNMINAGIYVLEPDVLSLIPPHTKFSFERQLFPLLLGQGTLYAHPSDAYWIDMGTPEKYFQLNRDLLGGKVSPAEDVATDGDVLIGEGSQVHPNAQIKGPTVLGPGCSVLQDAVIEQSILWSGVKVGRGARIRNSIVADHCHLGDGSIIEDTVLGDNVTVVNGGKLRGSKIWPGTSVEAETGSEKT